MNNAKVKFMIMLCCSLVLGGCDDDSDPQPQNSLQVEESELLGLWRVQLYQDEQENETSSFSGITFEFATNNEFIIFRNNSELLTGTWTLRDQGRELDITVPSLADENESFGEDLYEVSDDWDITFFSETALHLVDEGERFELLRVP
ncbi:hypothetical protein FNH22_12765 [Fulvivirga sp. M361]|uniref:hypothetical protein n=1 Tax=Fulvivirga sp. M361 TaxID=2594266 RepID=UPI00117B91DE|nr:hypothetical protein [Fulvivirga sp. M361]TRX58742.1 hypothetical protein FNH22_12765 [Fulvivirga sp. M361]